MTRTNLLLAAWTVLAGIGIPLIGVLNGGVARAVGSPLTATAIMFAVALLAAVGLALPLHGPPSLAQLSAAPVSGYAAGLLIGFYALSATVLIPRFGAGDFVAFILLAQLATAAAIDQFGWFGLPRQPTDAARAAGFALIVGGIALLQLSGGRHAS